MTNYRPETPSMSPRHMHSYSSLIDMEISPMPKYGDLQDLSLAMAYIPWQRWKNVYDLNKALKAGTIFPELDMPFIGMRGDRI